MIMLINIGSSDPKIDKFWSPGNESGRGPEIQQLAVAQQTDTLQVDFPIEICFFYGFN